MKRIEADGFNVKKGRIAYIFAETDEVATIPLETGETLVPLDIKEGDGLVLWLLNSADDDDGFRIFTVGEDERVFAIATIASLGLVD